MLVVDTERRILVILRNGNKDEESVACAYSCVKRILLDSKTYFNVLGCFVIWMPLKVVSQSLSKFHILFFHGFKYYKLQECCAHWGSCFLDFKSECGVGFYWDICNRHRAMYLSLSLSCFYFLVLISFLNEEVERAGEK